MAKTKIVKKIYEMAVLINKNISEEKVNNFYENLNAFLQENGGILIDFYSPKIVKLAYPIKKQSQAYLASTTFQLRREKIAEIENYLHAKEKEGKEILRYLILSKE